MEVANKPQNKEYDLLKLKNQLCFPLYAVSNKIIRKYKPLLDDLDLTYTQYITMMVLWEKKQLNEKTLGECLYLKSGTLAPLLKKLEAKGYITRARDKKDERNLVISITEAGEKLKDKAIDIPKEMANEIELPPEEAEFLYKILYKLLED
mgnify:CR=1 FL=1